MHHTWEHGLLTTVTLANANLSMHTRTAIKAQEKVHLRNHLKHVLAISPADVYQANYVPSRRCVIATRQVQPQASKRIWSESDQFGAWDVKQ